MFDFEDLFTEEVLEEGRTYFKSGKAKKLQADEEGYSATVRGSRNYRVRIETYWRDDREFIWSMECTCDKGEQGNYCKHMAAAMFLIDREYIVPMIEEDAPLGEAVKQRQKAEKAAGKKPSAKTDSGKEGAGSPGKNGSEKEGSGKGAAGRNASGEQGQEKSSGNAGRTPAEKPEGRREQSGNTDLPAKSPLVRGLAGLLREERRQLEAQAAAEAEEILEAETGEAGKTAAAKEENGGRLQADGSGEGGVPESNGSGTSMHTAEGKKPARRLPPRHMEPYRFFRYENFEKSVEVSHAALKEGKKLADSGEFEGLDVQFGYPRRKPWEDKAKDGLIGVASARFDNGREYVRIAFDEDSILEEHCTYWKCRGGYFDQKIGDPIRLCKHSAALLFMTKAFLERENPGDATSAGGYAMLDQNWQGNLTLEEAEDFEAPALKIEPAVTVPPYSADGECIPSVFFRVGTGRMYKIKRIAEFVNGMREGREMKFGTRTMIKLGEELLTEDSLIWYRFMQDALNEERQRNMALDPLAGLAGGYGRSSGYAVGNQIQDAVPLYGAGLDSFYQLAEGMYLEFTIRVSAEKDLWSRGAEDKHKTTLRLCEREMDLQLEISPFYTGVGTPDSGSSGGILQGIRVSGRVPRMIAGRSASYFVDEKKGEFCRVDRAQVEKIRPLLEAAQDGEIDARIGRRNLREFYRKALPRLREAVNVVEYDREIVESYLPPEPAFFFYFDIEDGLILCRPDVHYGLQIHTLIDLLEGHSWSGPPVDSYRDIEQEDRALAAVLRYVPQLFVELRVLVLEQEDEEKLFDLLANGLGDLLKIGEVRMTESFRRLGLRRQMKFSVGVSVESNLMDLQVLSEDLTEEELLAVFYQYQKKRKFVRLKNGDFFQLDHNETIEQLLEIMETMGVTPREFVRGKMQVPAYRALYLDKMLEQMEGVYADRDRRFKTLIKEFKTVEDADYEIPVSLRSVLRKYQAAGYRWLRTLDHYGFGGILADEMGLGKTLQVIAVLLSDKEARTQEPLLPVQGEALQEETTEIPASADSCAGGPSLVVCPASLVYNWGEELHRFAPALKVCLVTGTKKERSLLIAQYDQYDVLVTSYDLLKRDIDAYEGKNFRFEIIDEAQYIKNHVTAAAKSVKLVHAQTRFALTGTPIENRLSELWSIFDYLMPGFLYTYSQFHSDFEQKIVKFEDEAAAQRLRRMAAPFILRRRKVDVLRDLPEKLEEVRYAGMEAKQRKLYDGQVVRMKKSMKNQSESEFRKSRIQILAELMRIRQICCDPSLIIENYDGGSAKRETCMELIRNVCEGEHKALIFSQFASMLALLEEDLKKEGIAYFKITGSTPKEKRIEMVNSFNEDATPVFLISLKAGGTGLNLTGADVVIHYDPWWNVAAQNQATDRAHRIGQTRIVTVYKLIVKGTIEERILEMQERKEKLAEDILSAESISSSTISREELLELLG